MFRQRWFTLSDLPHKRCIIRSGDDPTEARWAKLCLCVASLYLPASVWSDVWGEPSTKTSKVFKTTNVTEYLRWNSEKRHTKAGETPNGRFLKIDGAEISRNRPPVCALTLANISGEEKLNCVLICIIVHINEVSAYEYAFLFCCLIKKRERGGGDHDRAGDGAEQKYGGRVNYDFRDISTILGCGGVGS